LELSGKSQFFFVEEKLFFCFFDKIAYTLTRYSHLLGYLGERHIVVVVKIKGISAALCEAHVTYANEAKEKLLGVPHQVLETVGAVSPETALAMAEGARRVSGSDIGVSTTGIAGPGGGTPEKPVGLVYIAIADKNGSEYRKLNLDGNRDEVRAKTCDEVFKLIKERLGF
jgi:PncC family amidohydrolase